MGELARKLALVTGQRIGFYGLPSASVRLIEAAAPKTCSFEPFTPAQTYQSIFLYPKVMQGLGEIFAMLQRQITMDGAIWVIMPKAKYARKRGVEITWLEMQSAALTTDLVDNKKVSLSTEDYATRFVIRRTSRSGG